MSLIDNLKAGATLTMIQVTQGLMDGSVTPTILQNGLELTIPYPEGFVPDPTAQAIWSEALASPQMLQFFGLDASKGQTYVLVKIYAVPTDPTNTPSLPTGALPLPDIDDFEGVDSSSIMHVWLLGAVGAPWKAAWSSGSQCFVLDENGNTIDAPTNITLAPNQWSGSGCIGKPRKEFAGISSVLPEWIKNGS